MTSSLEQGSLSPDLKYNTFRKFLNNGCVVEIFTQIMANVMHTLRINTLKDTIFGNK